jgi:hypothetical protein
MLVTTSVRLLPLHLLFPTNLLVLCIDIVLELVEGGDLLDYILTRNGIRTSCFFKNPAQSQH